MLDFFDYASFPLGYITKHFSCFLYFHHSMNEYQLINMYSLENINLTRNFWGVFVTFVDESALQV